MVPILDTVALDRRLRELARRRRVDLAEMSRLLLDLSRRKGWVDFSFASLGDYAAALLGFSALVARDLVAIAAKAESWEGVRAAGDGGEIDWTRLRTVVSEIDAENEGEWLEKARTMSVRQLEFEVAAAKGEAA